MQASMYACKHISINMYVPTYTYVLDWLIAGVSEPKVDSFVVGSQKTGPLDGDS